MILVALGCKSLYKAAAAHVNNNADGAKDAGEAQKVQRKDEIRG